MKIEGCLSNTELAKHNCRVHQPDDPPFMTREPRSPMVTVHWAWTDLSRLLDRLGAEVALERGGNRRTLRLTNPGVPIGTTHTFWGSVQHILPGEIATAHRHAAHAIRFIMLGESATTTVEGERYPMRKGDLLLTPAWTWHDHQHDGVEPMTWLDGLDISLVNSLQAMFFEAYPEDQQPVRTPPDRSQRIYGSGIFRPARRKLPELVSPIPVYSWDRAHAALREFASTDPDPFDDFVLEYQNPLTGGPALPTLGMALQWLRPGMHGRSHRHTGSVLYYVVQGEGASTVSGKRYEWSEGDFLAVPPWVWHEHENRSHREASILFQLNDLPVMHALGLYREEAHSGSGGQ